MEFIPQPATRGRSRALASVLTSDNCHLMFSAVTLCSHRGQQLFSEVMTPQWSGRGFGQTASLQDSEPISSCPAAAVTTSRSTPQTAQQDQLDQQAARRQPGSSRLFQTTRGPLPETQPGPGLWGQAQLLGPARRLPGAASTSYQSQSSPDPAPPLSCC